MEDVIYNMFKLTSKFKLTGDQLLAVKHLTDGLKNGRKDQTLIGVTGSGKTFSMANVIQQYKRPTLVISHNKTLAAQLYQELKDFFPDNAVHYFVSYYDYYQPEAYLAHSDTYIEKDAKINEEIDRLRHSATQALMHHDDVIIVASVSCIYNLGSPEEYKKMSLNLFEGQKISGSQLSAQLERLQFFRELDLSRGSYRRTTDEVEIVSSTGDEITKVKIVNDKIKAISVARNVNLEDLISNHPKYERVVETHIFPAKYWVSSDGNISVAIENIKAELQQHIKVLNKKKLYLEAERLQRRTEHDIEMLRHTGFCHGIENYSAHLDFRKKGEPPYTLIDYFRTKGKFLTIIDESHLTIPQVRGMFGGDHSRKKTLVEYGFRLPSAIDNRPLNFEEFEALLQNTLYVSATPKLHELEKSGKKGQVEQLVRPTGLLDPTVEIHKTKGQIEHLIKQIKKRVKNKQRILITTFTKRMAEDLTDYLSDAGIKVNYIHSDIKTLQRIEILHDLRLGNYDVIVGVNLLREGLDLPEVSLVAILDADKEGFLRNTTTLIQTMGRAARHVEGHVIMYADKITKSMQAAIDETNRRRDIQIAYNKLHKITPTTIQKAVKRSDLGSNLQSSMATGKQKISRMYSYNPEDQIVESSMTPTQKLEMLEKEMKSAVKDLKFERAIKIREKILKLRKEI